MMVSWKLKCFFTWLWTAQVLTLDFYVSTTGEDSNDGKSSTSPFLTPNQAQKTVQQAVITQTEDITIHFADGIYSLPEPLVLTAADSGKHGFKVTWTGSVNAVLSGGTQVTGWTLESSTGIYSANIATPSPSRQLYVNGWHAQTARALLNRPSFSFNKTHLIWSDSSLDWLSTLPGIEEAEIRGINSYKDRYSPVQSAANRSLVMAQPCWNNQQIGKYDTIQSPAYEGGFYIQNALALLDLGGEFFYNSTAGKVYYIPLAGEDMDTADVYLPRLELLVAVGGTYDEPAHDITFSGFSYAHTTWNTPTSDIGHVSTQTGGYIGINTSYADYVASKPFWYEIPSSIQISAARDITFTNGHYSQLGNGAIGVGNDDNAHHTGLGLGACNIAITDNYFTQVAGNSITAGGMQANAHHPNDTRMINSEITISGNIFYNVSNIWTATTPILATYIQNSTISHNDISNVPYSALCVGYGWGANDAGGSKQYIDQGNYLYQPLYTTPTTLKNNIVESNLIHNYGRMHTDLGGIYTLSKQPDSYFRYNYAYDSKWLGYYADEGTNSVTFENNAFMVQIDAWYHPNQGVGVNTGNNTLIGNVGGALGSGSYDFVNYPNEIGVWGNTYIENYRIYTLADSSPEHQRAAYRAGVAPGRRGSRPVSNEAGLSDSFLGIQFPENISTGKVTVNLSNFDDVPFTGVSFTGSIGNGYTLATVNSPTTVAANSFALATYTVSGSGCAPPVLSVKVTYTNPRTGVTNTLTQSSTLPGTSALPASSLVPTSSWPSPQFGYYGPSCNGIFGIRGAGRDTVAPFDDWTTLAQPSALSTAGSISAQVLAVDATNAWAKAGVVVRNNLTNNTRSAGYAALYVSSSNGIAFQWDNTGDGIFDSVAKVAGVVAPVFLKLNVNSGSAAASYSKDGKTWTRVGSSVTLSGANSNGSLVAGVQYSSHLGFGYGTAVFGNITAV